MHDAALIDRIRTKYAALAPVLDERSRRHWAATEATDLGRGGVTWVALATGLSRTTIAAGQRELSARPADAAPDARLRRPGAGRPYVVDAGPSLWDALDALVDPATRGDPESPLRWTCKSVRRIAEELQHEGHAVSYQTAAELLHELDHCLQANQKTLEGNQHADRDEQFEYINRKARRYLKQGEPVISVDTKKK